VPQFLPLAHTVVQPPITLIGGRTESGLLPQRAAAPSALPGVVMIRGWPFRMATVRIWAYVALVALRLYRHPLRAAAALRRMRASLAQGLSTMPDKAVMAAGRLFPSLYVPGYPSKAFDLAVERELDRAAPVLGRPAPLRSVIVAITRMCALRCEHCLEWDVLNHAEGMSADELRAIVRQLRQRGVAQLFFSGGEPLQRFDLLLELVALLSDETDVWVLSSGRGLTSERARRLRDAGLTGVALSLDHWDAAEHDRFRGRQGAFDAVRQAAGCAREAGLLLALSLCPVRAFVSHDNLRRYADVAGSMGAHFLQIFEPKAIGHYAGQDVALAPAQVQALEQFVEWLNHDPTAERMPVVSYMAVEVRNGGCCGAGDQYAYVDTEGALHPCPFCRDHPVPLLGRDVDAAFAELQAAGCPSHPAP
jgi:MoaA/NifB/PqqE/SkfB family radical SAM enzyme